MQRRTFLAMFLMFDEPPLLGVLSKLASALTAGNAAAAMAVFDKDMPAYASLSTNVYALTAQSDILCSIDPTSETEADFFLQIRSKQENGPTERREETVTISIAKIGANWKITDLKPLSILDPPKLAGTF